MKVIILGASDKAERYAYQAMKLLQKHGHQTYLVHPTLKQIEGQKVFSNISQVNEEVDTVTVYVNANVSNALQEEFLKLKPRRVIFNPGAENLPLSQALRSQNIFVENACTLVLLKTGQF